MDYRIILLRLAFLNKVQVYFYVNSSFTDNETFCTFPRFKHTAENEEEMDRPAWPIRIVPPGNGGMRITPVPEPSKGVTWVRIVPPDVHPSTPSYIVPSGGMRVYIVNPEALRNTADRFQNSDSTSYPVFGSEDPGSWLERGDILGSQERYDEALEAYAHGLSLYKSSSGSHPAFAEIYSSMGLTYIKLGQYQEALVNLQHAVDLGNTGKYVRERRAMAYLALHQWQSAFAECDFMINWSKRHPPSSKAWNYVPYLYRGRANAGLGKYKEAIADYDNAIACAPNERDTYYRRGNTYFELKDYRRARADYDAALRKHPDDEVDQDDLRVKREEAYRQLMAIGGASSDQDEEEGTSRDKLQKRWWQFWK